MAQNIGFSFSCLIVQTLLVLTQHFYKVPALLASCVFCKHVSSGRGEVAFLSWSELDERRQEEALGSEDAASHHKGCKALPIKPLLFSGRFCLFFNIVPHAWEIKARWLPFWLKLEELTELEIHCRAHGKHLQALKSWKDYLQFHWKRRQNITVKYLLNRASPEQFYYSLFTALIINKSVE